MEGSMICQKNILGHSMMFHGDYIKRCLLTIRVSQILSLTQLISEIKNIITAANGLFYNGTILWSGTIIEISGALLFLKISF
jgi:hypothetical protein